MTNKNKKQKKTTIPDKDGHYDIDGVSYKNEHVYLGSDDIPEDKALKDLEARIKAEMKAKENKK